MRALAERTRSDAAFSSAGGARGAEHNLSAFLKAFLSIHAALTDFKHRFLSKYAVTGTGSNQRTSHFFPDCPSSTCSREHNISPLLHRNSSERQIILARFFFHNCFCKQCAIKRLLGKHVFHVKRRAKGTSQSWALVEAPGWCDLAWVFSGSRPVRRLGPGGGLTAVHWPRPAIR